MSADAPRRERQPDRRPSETRRLEWGGRTIFVTVGYGEDAVSAREIFYDGGYKSGSDMEALVSDLCIALSVMLQHEGITAATLRRSMSVAFDLRTGDPGPASVLGVLLEQLDIPPGWAAAPGAGDGNGGAGGAA